VVDVARIVYRHSTVERFVVSAIGDPGEREFFVQIRSADGLNTLKVEKEQVRALVIRFEEMLTQLRRSKAVEFSREEISSKVDEEPLELPLESDFTVGIVAISIINSLFEITFQGVSGQEELVLDDLDNGPDLLIALLDPIVVAAFSIRAKKIIESGRAICPFCGLPIDLNGHLCPRANGYRR